MTQKVTGRPVPFVRNNGSMLVIPVSMLAFDSAGRIELAGGYGLEADEQLRLATWLARLVREELLVPAQPLVEAPANAIVARAAQPGLDGLRILVEDGGTKVTVELTQEHEGVTLDELATSLQEDPGSLVTVHGFPAVVPKAGGARRENDSVPSRWQAEAADNSGAVALVATARRADIDVTAVKVFVSEVQGANAYTFTLRVKVEASVAGLDTADPAAWIAGLSDLAWLVTFEPSDVPSIPADGEVELTGDYVLTSAARAVLPSPAP